MDEKIKEHIQTADWAFITRKLASYASHRARYVFRITNDYTVLPMGFSVEAVVQESIMKFLDGTRKWDPDRVEMLGFLMGVVKSEIGHLAGLIDNKLADRTSTPEDLENFKGEGLNPEENLLEKETKNVIEVVYQKLIEQAESDSEYELIASCIMLGISKPADIARETGIEIKRVYSLKKHWQRDFEKVLQEVLAEAN